MYTTEYIKPCIEVMEVVAEGCILTDSVRMSSEEPDHDLDAL